jgi:tagatose 1,6-diphosphate aldolase GatY/KbaY
MTSNAMIETTDALAAVGNVHGISTTPVVVSLDRLAAIRDAVDLPIVLHGASGLPDTDIRIAIGHGVAKINVNPEVRRAATAVVRQKIRVFDGSQHLGESAS